MTPEEAIQLVDEILIAHTGKPLTDIHRLILSESLMGKAYETMESDYSLQYIKNEGKKLWDLLSEALGEKVSKTSFQGALEKQLKSSDEVALKPPTVLTYNEITWVGREALITELLPKLQGQTRLLWLTGISGIGKSTLGECLATKAWESNRSFRWVYLEVLDRQNNFCDVVSELLFKLEGIDLDSQIRENPEQLTQILLQKLRSFPYWLQLDSLENLIENPTNAETKFVNPDWANFFQRCLTESEFSSRLVLTSQAFPKDLENFNDKYSNTWAEYRLKGLLAEESQQKSPMEFFVKRGVKSASKDILSKIAETYEGHPLALKVIAEEIVQEFGGNVADYWEAYQREFEEVARELKASFLDETEYNNTLDRKVRERIKKSLEQLPKNALDLLRRSSVFRCPAPKKFWMKMFSASVGDDKAERSPDEQNAAYQSLEDRALIEKEGRNIRQHNLIRNISYHLLKADPVTWKAAECKAAELWCTEYQPKDNDSKFEKKARGLWEAFHHYCNAENWKKAEEIFTEKIDSTQSTLRWQLDIWGCYQQEIILCERLLLGECGDDINFQCWKGIGDAYYGLANYPKAIDAYKQSLEFAKKTDNRSNEANSLENLGLVYNQLGNYSKALELIKKALSISEETDNLQDKSSALINLGAIYNNWGNYQEAINLSTQALNIIEKDNLQGRANALGNLAVAYGSIGEFSKAINYLNESQDIMEKIENSQIKCIVLGNLGRVYRILGQPDKAMNSINESREIAVRIGDRKSESDAFNNLGNAHRDKKNHILTPSEYSLMIEEYKKQLESAEEIGYLRGKGDALGNLGAVYQDKGDYDKAMGYHEQCLKIVQDIGDRQGEGIALLNLGKAQFQLKQYSESSEYYLKALEIFEAIGDRPNTAEALINLGEMCVAQKKLEEAQEHYDGAEELAKELGLALLEEKINSLKIKHGLK